MGAYRSADQRRWKSTALALSLSLACRSVLADSNAASLGDLSIDDLAKIDITSVSKRAEPLNDAAAAIYVITHDDIVRSGATSLGEILRLAPNLQVAQMSANDYAITARGFNGNAADKLLVLIDGRSVYTPLYGGVLWDEKDVLPDSIERIEVISGPGATLWGANAVNGVINVITRDAASSQGGVLDVGYGSREERASLSYGGKIADDLAYRLYAEGFSLRDGKTSLGTDAYDGLTKPQGGFRLDWTPGADSVSLRGDLYRGSEGGSGLDQDISGGNFSADWRHRLEDGSSLQLFAYYDETRRFTNGYGGYSLDSWDVEFQHSLTPFEGFDLVWGAGYRNYRDQFENFGAVQFLPAASTEQLADVFAQGTVTLTPSLKMVLGLKLEKDPYSGLEPLPNARLSWKADEDLLLWSAVSRAVRAPTLFDEDLQDTLIPGVVILTGNHDFRSEKVTAYEVGGRAQPFAGTTISVSAYYNVYDDLRSLEWLNMNTLPFLWQWGNLMEGDVYGVEVWGSWQATRNWVLAAGFNLQHEALRFKPGASSLNNLDSAGDDPHHQATLRSTVGLTDDLSWTADFRYIGALPNPSVPAYPELNTSIAWSVTESVRLSLTGSNLLHAHHVEYEEAGDTFGDVVYRSVFVDARWRF